MHRGDPAFPVAPRTKRAFIGLVGALGGLALVSRRGWAAPEEEGVRAAQSIHQEVELQATRKRVYDALTDSEQFAGVQSLSEAMRQGGMSLGAKPPEISRDAGGAFALFGGYIVGRQIELVPNERIVQAWRAAGWPAGIFSIARFELVEKGSSTRIIFDHGGFPAGQGEHLARGWNANYWEPLAKFLS